MYKIFYYIGYQIKLFLGSSLTMFILRGAIGVNSLLNPFTGTRLDIHQMLSMKIKVKTMTAIRGSGWRMLEGETTSSIAFFRFSAFGPFILQYKNI